MLYLIDGYNLLYRLGIVTAQTGPNNLEHARRRLLALMHAAHGERSRDVVVVFDAKRSPPGMAIEQNYQGIQVRFAARHPEADDLLEELIQQAEHPRGLAVVSDDHRIQHAARRHGCVMMPCTEYMDWLGQTQRAFPQNIPAAPEKPAVVSEDESAYWQQAFANLDDDPAMRELFEIPWSDPDKPS